MIRLLHIVDVTSAAEETATAMLLATDFAVKEKGIQTFLK